MECLRTSHIHSVLSLLLTFWAFNALNILLVPALAPAGIRRELRIAILIFLGCLTVAIAVLLALPLL